MDIPGWFNFYDVYDRAVAHFPSGSHFVEVGSWKGRSAAYMAVAIANSGKDISFTCVDTWQGSADHREKGIDCSNLFSQFVKNTAGLKIGPIRGESVKEAAYFDDSSLDFVFLDASHNKEAVAADIRAWRPKLKPDGVLAGDDLPWESVQQGLRLGGIENIVLSGERTAWIAPNGDPKPWITPMEKERAKVAA